MTKRSNDERQLNGNANGYVISAFLVISIPIYIFVAFLAFIPQYIFALILFMRYKVSEDDEEKIKDKKLVNAMSLLMVYHSIMIFITFLRQNEMVWGLLIFNLFVCGVSYLVFYGLSTRRGQVKKMNPILRFIDGPIFGSVDAFILVVFYLFSSLMYVSALFQALFNAM